MKKKSKGERLGWRHLHEVEPIKLTVLGLAKLPNTKRLK
jgi:hypothetical protein